ncbi:MAG: hypothetical protein QXX17_04400 [Conexivisphaerales archaeon]
MSQKSTSTLLMVGVGTAGCSIVDYMRKAGFKAEYCFASLRQKDIPADSPTLDWGSFDSAEGFDYLAELSANADFVVSVGDAGGKSGSYLLPKVSRIARNEGKPALAVALLPFSREKWLEYKAGICMTKLKKTRCGMMVVDKEQFVDGSMAEMPVEKVYQKIDEQIASTLMGLLSKGDEVASILSRGQSVMHLASIHSGFERSFADAITSVLKTDMRDVDEMYVVSSGNRPISFDDSDTASSAVRNIVSPVSKVHFVNYNIARSDLQSLVALIGHVEGSVSSRVYDPIEAVLGNKWLDTEPELGLNIPLELDRID